MAGSVFLILLLMLAGKGYADLRTDRRESSKFKNMFYSRALMFENLCNVYDPSFLSVVWTKIRNGVHVTVAKPCWEDVGTYLTALHNGQSWAYNVLDSTGRYHSGLFIGNRYWLGSKNQCLRMNNRREMSMQNGMKLHSDSWNKKYDDENHRQYVLHYEDAATAEPGAPYNVGYTTLEIDLKVYNDEGVKTYGIILGVCLPETCSTEDVVTIIKFSNILNDKLKSNNTKTRSVRVVSAKRIESNGHVTAATVVIIVITLFLFVISVIASLVDSNIIQCKFYSRKSMSFDISKKGNYDTKKYSYDNNLEEYEQKELKTVEKSTGNSIDYMNDSNVTVTEKINNEYATSTRDAVLTGTGVGSCTRCGKYKNHCISSVLSDCNLQTCNTSKYSNSFASLSTEVKRSILYRFLLCFSLQYSWKRIFNTNMANSGLAVIHLLRIVTTLWVIFLHVAVVANYISDSSGVVNVESNAYYIITTGTLAFDVLFFVSGVFSSHHFFYLKSQYTVEELVSFGGCGGQMLQFICFVTNRAIRLLPSYSYVVLLTYVLMRTSRETSALYLPELDQDNCRSYWWRNLLYISTLYARNERCIQISWYFSTETQLHAAGVLLCIIWAGAWSKISAILAVAALLAATVADVNSAYIEYGSSFKSMFEAYAVLIDSPWSRISPYLVGIFGGWLIHKTEGILRVPKIASGCLWTCSFIIICLSMGMPWLAPAWVTSWLHLPWSAALLWPAFVCSAHYSEVSRRILSSSLVAGVSRLCYSMLLLHGVITRYMLLAMPTALCSHPLCLWSYFAGVTLFTLPASLILTLLIEMPSCSLLRRISDCAST